MKAIISISALFNIFSITHVFSGILNSSSGLHDFLRLIPPASGMNFLKVLRKSVSPRAPASAGATVFSFSVTAM